MFDLRLPSTIFHVQLNRKRLLIHCEGQIFIYDMATMTKLFYLTVPSSSYSFTAIPLNSNSNHVLDETESNSPTGQFSSSAILPTTIQVAGGKHIASLSPNSEESFFAIPDINIPGDLLVYDTSSSEPVSVNAELGRPSPALRISQAHKSSIAYVKFNSSGNLIATASDKVWILS